MNGFTLVKANMHYLCNRSCLISQIHMHLVMIAILAAIEIRMIVIYTKMVEAI